MCKSNECERILRTKVGKYTVSTVTLLGNSRLVELPLQFETMVYSHIGKDVHWEDVQSRYASYMEAIEGHEEIVRVYEHKVKGESRRSTC